MTLKNRFWVSENTKQPSFENMSFIFARQKYTNVGKSNQFDTFKDVDHL